MNPVESLLTNTCTIENPDSLEGSQSADISGPFPTCQHVLECQFSSWYPVFSNIQNMKRKNVTIKSVIVQNLSEKFESYLLSDGLTLPLGAERLSSCGQGNTNWSSDEEEEIEEEQDPEQNVLSFPELNQQLIDAIEKLGGSVMPKLNWSAPKDASWVNGGSLKCETIGDIYLLIKSSDFCMHDILRKAWGECVDSDQTTLLPPPLELILRKWCNLHPSMEFRCFVRQKELLAISQRDHTQHYAFLAEDQSKIRDYIMQFFEDVVRDNFAKGEVANYVFDVYIDKKNRLWLLDFNIWAKSTDGLLFEWSELLTMDTEDDPQFRLVETANQVRQDPLASYRAPVDTLDLASLTGGTSKNFEEFMKQCQSPSQLATSVSEEA